MMDAFLPLRAFTSPMHHVLAGVALIEHAVHGVTLEVWVSSTTGAIRTMSPRRAQPRR